MVTPAQLDPSGTGPLQRAFIKDLTNRFARLKRALLRLIVDEDAFGIGDGKPLPVGPTQNTRWKFATGPEKMKQFEKWLDDQVKSGILSEDGSGGGDVTGARYIRSTYKQALVSTYRKVNKDKLKDSAGEFYEGSQNAFLKDTFESSEAASKMAMLGTRVYSSLKDVTSTMDAKMSRILAQGLADGKSPRDLGRQLAAEVDGISKSRGAMIARTEIIHTHAEGQLDAFEALKVHDLTVLAEWLVTPDKRLCSKCAELQGIVLTIPEARGLLPRHPNCRCAWIPADVGESKKGQIRTKAGIEGAIERSVKEERPNAETKDAFKLSKWLGADVKVDTRPKSVDSLPMFAPAEGLWGQQPTAVMRWMGKEGWSAKDAQRVLKEMGVDAAEGTIKTQLGAGAKGLRGPAASLTDEQMAILRAKKAGDGIIKPPPINPPVLPPPPVNPPPIVPGAGSPFSEEVFHVTTSEEAAASIRSTGFDPTRTGSGKAFGQGSYFATDKKTKDFYVKLTREDGFQNPVTITAKVELNNVATIDTTKWTSLQRDIRQIPKEAAKALGRSEEYKKTFNEMVENNQRILADYSNSKPSMSLREFKKLNGFVDDLEAQALRRVAIDAGYDGLRVIDNAVDPAIGGNQIVVFDKNKIRLVTKPVPIDPVIPPPKLPPITPPPVNPPVIVPGELPPIPAINQPGTSVARWLGKEGFTFKEARKVLDEAGIKISDATLKTQLGAGAKGLRGAAATLTDAQAAAFRARRVLPPPGVQIAKTITKPVKLARVLPPPPSPVVAVKAEFEQITVSNVRERIAGVKSLDDFVDKIKKERGEYFDAFTRADKKLREIRQQYSDSPSPETKRAMNEATKEWQAAWNKRAGVMGEMRTKVHKMLALDKEDRINLKMNVAEKADSEFKEKTETARSFIESITKKFQGGIMKSPSGGVRITQSKIENLSYRAEVIKGRAHYVAKGIHCDNRDELKTFVHEIAHGIEQDMPMMRHAAECFRQARIAAAGTVDIAMNEAAPGHGFDKHEKGNKDEFDKYFEGSHAYYCGKSYGISATEIISMGTEALYHDPAGFASKDPEYFKFIVGVLRGDLW
jgi:SPP1 gp7 family putative phage head morphogenesis protein